MHICEEKNYSHKKMGDVFHDFYAPTRFTKNGPGDILWSLCIIILIYTYVITVIIIITASIRFSIHSNTWLQTLHTNAKANCLRHLYECKLLQTAESFKLTFGVCNVARTRLAFSNCSIVKFGPSGYESLTWNLQLHKIVGNKKYYVKQ